MAKPADKLSQSLRILEGLQKTGMIAIRASALSRVHRERLVNNGFLQEVIKGWYIATRPDMTPGESTAWYTSFWGFCAGYLKARFGSDWCLSPEQSMSLHADNNTIPQQLLVRSPKASNKVTNFLHGTSMLDIRASIPSDDCVEESEGLRIFSLPTALVACGPSFFQQYPTDARAVLAMVTDPSELLKHLLDGGHSTVAGRLAGAFRNIGSDKTADTILATMRTVGYSVREHNPFDIPGVVYLAANAPSPYVNRIHLMWQQMRNHILDKFPHSTSRSNDINAYLQSVEESYITDAYHSLSIEGYQVNAKLLERVATGDWNPDSNESDRKYRNALAARGYWQSYQVVKGSLRKILNGENAGLVAENDHSDWYRELFAPCVIAGIIQPSDLIGYRKDQVFIRNSMHVPPRREAIHDSMLAFFELLKTETEASVRAVLGHFLFVYIHPYMDGNGRMARFLMNLMLASGDYPWIVIPVQSRKEYMESLEAASVHLNIGPFTEFLSKIMIDSLKGTPTAHPPS